MTRKTGLLIQGGVVIDGTGAVARRADVRVRGGRIAEVGPDLAREGEPVIDADGAIVAPGFIDSHTHLDATLFWDPFCDPMPQHGVTTVLIGNCSLGLAPARAETRARMADAFSYIEDIPREILTTAVPWTWKTFQDYADVLRQQRFGVNVCALVGHSMLRSFAMGEAAWERASTPAESAAISDMLGDALKAGALGMSTSLTDRDRDGHPVPSYYADDAEFNELFQVLRRYRGLCQFLPRNDEIGAACADMARMATFARRYDTTVIHNIIAHKPNEPSWSETLLDFVKRQQEAGTRFYSQVTPRAFELSVNFEQTYCFVGIPAWNRLVHEPNPEAKRAMLQDVDWRAQARRDFDSCTKTSVFPSDRIHMLRITAVHSHRHGSWIGRTLQDLVDLRSGHPSDVLADWVLENDLDTRFSHPAANSDPSGVAPLLCTPQTMISASDAGAHLQMFCGSGDTTLLLTRYVRERGDLTLEAAVHALTGRQADLLGLSQRGRLCRDAFADLVIFALDELHLGDERLVSDMPGGGRRFTRDPGGYRFTIVNGEVVQKGGYLTGRRPAVFLDTR